MGAGYGYHCHCEERSDVAISWYDLSVCYAGIKIPPGDCHGPKGPRNDTVVVGGLRSLYRGKKQFISSANGVTYYEETTHHWLLPFWGR